MNIYNDDYKRRKPRMLPESKEAPFDLNKHSGRLIAVGTDRWKWNVKGSKVTAISETGERLLEEAYKLVGYSDQETYEQDRADGSSATSINPAIVANWIRRFRSSK